MDVYDRWIMKDSNDFHEERFYCSPAVKPEDIIWEESDAEESLQETEFKRLRYDDHARRYLDGKLPVLISAGLRGPFDSNSGWINPWRYRPLENSHKCRAGSEHKLSTRSSMVQRVAEHGLGYSSPAEALAWCRTTAEAESGPGERRTSRGRHMESMMSLNTYNIERGDGKQRNDGEGCDPVTFQPDASLRRTLYEPFLEMVDNRHTVPSGGSRNNNNRGRQRPMNPQWLRGSNVSRRTRQASQSMSSPTPDVQSDRDRRRRQDSTRSMQSSKAQGYETIEKRTINTLTENSNPREIQQLADFLPKKRIPRARPVSMLVSGQPDLELGKLHDQNGGDVDKIYDNVHEHSVASTVGLGYESKSRLRNGRPDTADCSVSNFQHHDLMAMSLVQKLPPNTSAYDDHKSVKRQSRTRSRELSNHSHNINRDPADEGAFHMMEENNFVSQVASSSGDLETFQYRKRRKTRNDQLGDLRHRSPNVRNVARKQSGDMLPGEETSLVSASFDNTGNSEAVPLKPETDEPAVQRVSALSSVVSDGTWAKIEGSLEDSANGATKPPKGGHILRESDSHTSLAQIIDSSKADVASEADSPSSQLSISSILMQHPQPDPTSTRTSKEGFALQQEVTNNSKESYDSRLYPNNMIHARSMKSSDDLPPYPLEPNEAIMEMVKSVDGAESSDEIVQDETNRIQLVLPQDHLSASGHKSTETESSNTEHEYLTGDGEELAKNISVAPSTGGTQTPKGKDHVEWTGKEIPSPWETANLGPLSAVFSTENRVDHSLATIDAEGAIKTVSSSPQAEYSGTESRWQPLHRRMTPENDGIRPFKDFMTPTPSPERKKTQEYSFGLPSTQVLVDAITNNPWTSNFRNPMSEKSTKRVSFGVLPSEESRDQPPGGGSSLSRPPSSPPPPLTMNQPRADDIFTDGTTTVNKFENHFAAAALRRKRQGNYNSPFQSSPALGAMAEAFIAADRQVLSEQVRQPTSDRSPNRRAAQMDVAPQDITSAAPTLDSFSISPNGNIKAVSTNMTSNDLDDNVNAVLGDIGSYLESWSVEAELRKVNALNVDKENGATSSKRRRLVGIVNR